MYLATTQSLGSRLRGLPKVELVRLDARVPSGLFDRINEASLGQIRPAVFAEPQELRKFVHKRRPWVCCAGPFTRSISPSPAAKMADLKNLFFSINYMG